MTTSEIAKEIEEVFHTESDSETPFELGCARLYGVDVSKGKPTLSLIGEDEDVYDLISDENRALMAGAYEWALIVTTGWASPLNADGEAEGRPSEHPQRRRVRLACIASGKGVASVLRFADEPNDPITDEGQAVGSLADALQDFVVAGYRNN